MKPDGTLATLLARFRADKGIPENSEALAALQAEFDAFRASTEANVQELSEGLQVALATVESLEKERDAAVEKLAALETANAQSAAEAAQAKVDVRKAKIVAAVGTDRAQTVFEAVSSLEDAAFEAVVAAMTAASAAEAKSAMFTETGLTAEANANVVDTPSKEMQILRQKYADSAAA